MNWYVKNYLEKRKKEYRNKKNNCKAEEIKIDDMKRNIKGRTRIIEKKEY